MWFDGIRQPNTLYTASVSRGKDSTAMLRAIQIMNWPLDVVMAVDIWFDDDTPAEYPELVEFKRKWDKRCEDMLGVPVIHLCSMYADGRKKTYVSEFYREFQRGVWKGERYGFPTRGRNWCNRELKMRAMTRVSKINAAREICEAKGYDIDTMKTLDYVGIAADEGVRIDRRMKDPKSACPACANRLGRRPVRT